MWTVVGHYVFWVCVCAFSLGEEEGGEWMGRNVCVCAYIYTHTYTYVSGCSCVRVQEKGMVVRWRGVTPQVHTQWNIPFADRRAFRNASAHSIVPIWERWRHDGDAATKKKLCLYLSATASVSVRLVLCPHRLLYYTYICIYTIYILYIHVYYNKHLKYTYTRTRTAAA